ncbi:MAG: pilin [Gammaproteobacteria bacterium]|nr:pilin [Gammaproteobacteria bacterium]
MSKKKGFSLIESLVSLTAIAGIFMSMQNQELNKQHVNQAIEQSKDPQEAIVAYYSKNGVLPTSNKEANIPEPDQFKNSLLSELKINEFGDIVLTFAKNVDFNALSDKTIILEPKITNGTFHWGCKSGSLDNKYRPSNCYNSSSGKQTAELNYEITDKKLPDAIIDFINDANLI